MNLAKIPLSPIGTVICKEPYGAAFSDLIFAAFESCDHMSLFVRSGLRLHSSGKQVLKRMEPFLVSDYWGHEWPHTSGQRHHIRCYKTCDELRDIVLDVSQSLYQWVQPKLPEDPAFYRKNKIWLHSITHEKMSFLSLTDKEQKDLLLRYPRLKPFLGETYPVTL